MEAEVERCDWRIATNQLISASQSGEGGGGGRVARMVAEEEMRRDWGIATNQLIN
jgi:hypothetical protein